jgi:uncharacterized protein YdaU (DUF1376 family)
MHYYQFNIGDYVSHTRHLSPIEDIAYRRLLDAYYLSERPLNSGLASVARQIGMREYEEEVNLVLQEFFILGEAGWTNSRADKEITHYKSKIDQASRAGKASAERRLNGRSTDVPTDVQPTNNQEPITKNHKPIKETAIAVCPINVDEQVWSDFLALRKVKKAPMTVTALAGIKREADKANWSLDKAISECVARGWTGFKADWVAEKANRFDVVLTTTPPPANQDAALKRIMEDDKKAVPPPFEVLKRMAELRKNTA